MNLMQKAVIKKDLRAITSNKRMFSTMLIVPLVMTVVLPSILILTVRFMPQETSDFQGMLDMLPLDAQMGDMTRTVISLTMNNIIPIFFMMIPIMAASVMAASSFVGEKEKRTLETLLYSPLTLKEIVQAKILASFIMSMLVSVLSFVVMTVVTQTEILLTTGSLMPLSSSWLIVMLLLSPAVSLMSITLIVSGSAKAQSMEESQQRSVFLILPIILLVMGQFGGLILVNAWLLLGLSVLFGVAALLLMNSSYRKISYETLLR